MPMQSDVSTSPSDHRTPTVVGSRSAGRVLDILDLFLDGGSTYTLTAVSEHLCIPKSTAHGVLHAMHRHGYLAWDPSTGDYSISLQLLGRAAAAPVMKLIRFRARPHLERLAQQLGETAILIGYEAGESVAVDVVEGPHALKYAVRTGRGWPLYATGGGKLFLARLSEDEVRRMFGHGALERVTSKTIVDVDALLDELADVRRAGWAQQREEIIDQVSGFAAPVTDSLGVLIASLVVTGPASRVEAEQEAILAALMEQARVLTGEFAGNGDVPTVETVFAR